MCTQRRVRCATEVTLSIIAILTTAPATTWTQGCPVGSLFDLCAFPGRDLTKEQRQAMVKAYPGQ